jgi:hypothetical protein
VRGNVGYTGDYWTAICKRADCYAAAAAAAAATITTTTTTTTQTDNIKQFK